MADDEVKEYTWESGYEKTWEAIEENAEGLLEPSVSEIIQKAKRKRLEGRHNGGVQLGMMRHLYIIVDLSECMTEQDLKPTRQICTAKLLEGFVDEFFDQNPISQVGIIAMRNKRAEKVSELAGNPKKHIEMLRTMSTFACSGEPSLQNALELALQTLRHIPAHASREVMVIFGNLTTCDPTDIEITIQNLKKENIRCSVVGLSSEIRICKQLCKETGGEHGVMLDEMHLKELVYQCVMPPLAVANTESSLIKMGFPHHFNVDDKDGVPAMCMCHLDNDPTSNKLSTNGYICPQCGSKYCELPVECRACNLTLVSAPHLARSYHHLFPLKNFSEIGLGDYKKCFACQKKFKELQKTIFKCGGCSEVFCFECDLYIHDSLHTCPGCATNPSVFHKS